MRSNALSVICSACAALLLLGGPSPGLAADPAVDLELVLAVDVSGSMDSDERELQRTGYASALVHPDVLAAIRSGPHGRIAVTYAEWAGPAAHRVVVPWTLVDGPETARAVSDLILAAPLGRMRGTSISGGLRLASGLFGESGFAGTRRVIDISGDGPNNMGEPVAPVRDAVVESGIVINGLPIMLRPGGGYAGTRDLDIYYEDCVIGGPGAFIVPVRDPEQLAPAIRRKLVLEIAGTRRSLVVPASSGAPRIDCMIGENARRLWMEP